MVTSAQLALFIYQTSRGRTLGTVHESLPLTRSPFINQFQEIESGQLDAVNEGFAVCPNRDVV